MIFIDANQYLQLYRTDSGKKMLAPLLEQEEHIFVTEQIVNEVLRNKLQVAARYLQEQIDLFRVRSIGVPDHLLGCEETELAELRKQMGGISGDAEKMRKEFELRASETLRRISHSGDEISAALEELFKKAVKPTCQEYQKAYCRKQVGNPPGKKGDPLGDQISWEQFVNHAMGIQRLWIISNDCDFITSFKDEAFLNPLLLRDLLTTCGTRPEIFCFNTMIAGLNHFVSTSGRPRGSLPSGEEAKMIEEDFLANYYCGNLSLTVQGDRCGTHLMTYSCGVWLSPEGNVVIRKDRVMVDGNSYPVRSLRPFLADFVHNGRRFTITQ